MFATMRTNSTHTKCRTMTKMSGEKVDHSTNAVWEKQARRLVKIALVREDVSLSELVKRLHDIGVSENAQNLSNKISRGKFSFSFFLQIMKALEVKQVDLDDH